MGETQSIVSVADVLKRAKLELGILATRHVGGKFLQALREEITLAGQAEAIILDFGDVAFIDASFADEVFGTLASERARRKYKGPSVVLRSLKPWHLENISMALESRPRRESGLRNAVVPFISESGDVQLLGKYEDHVAETLRILRNHKQMTARDLADQMKIQINAASTRLKVLYDLGLAGRNQAAQTSKEYTYRSIF